LNRLFKKLNEPFPDPDSPKESFITILWVGLFITLFLYFISPNEIHNYQGNTLLLCARFGLITILVAWFLDLLIIHVLKIDRSLPSWTLWKWIVSMIVLVSCIGIANYGYIVYLTSLPVHISHFIEVMSTTVLIGLFPIAFSGLVIQINANKKNQIQAAHLQPHFPIKKTQEREIHFSSNNKKQNLALPVQNVLYLEAMQNYVSVCYQKDGATKKELLRNTIKNIESDISDSPLIRCHRSFIVNSDLIEKVEGNAQGLRLSLKNLDEVIVPVSRKYIPILKGIIGK